MSVTSPRLPRLGTPCEHGASSILLRLARYTRLSLPCIILFAYRLSRMLRCARAQGVISPIAAVYIVCPRVSTLCAELSNSKASRVHDTSTWRAVDAPSHRSRFRQLGTATPTLSPLWKAWWIGALVFVRPPHLCRRNSCNDGGSLGL